MALYQRIPPVLQGRRVCFGTKPLSARHAGHAGLARGVANVPLETHKRRTACPRFADAL
jgi:hypothetical protein